MHQFTFDDSRFGEVQNKVILRLALILIIVVPLSLFTGYFQTGSVEVDIKSVIPAVIIVAVFACSGYSQIKKLRQQHNSIVITIDENSITRSLQDVVAQSVPFANIVKINKLSSGDLQIKSANTFLALVVPAQMNNYDTLLEMLNNIHPITQSKSQNLIQKYGIILSALTILPMSVVMYSNNKTLVLACGIPLVIALCIGLFALQKSTVVMGSLKKKLWLVILPIIYLICTMYIKLNA